MKSALFWTLAAAFAFSGCSKTRSCTPGTLLIDVDLQGASVDADTLTVAIALPGATRMASGPHKAGVARGTLQVDFAATYPGGQAATVTVTALSKGAPLGQGTTGATTLGATCSRLSITVATTNGDMAMATDMAATDMTSADLNQTVATPRLLAPLSTAHVTSQQPTLRWTMSAGGGTAQVDLCADRGCLKSLTIAAPVDISGTSAKPTVPLAAGVVFWRVRVTGNGQMNTSAVWQLTVGKRSAAVASSWGATLDVDGDGLADVVAGAPGTNSNAGRAHLYYGSAGGPKNDASAVTLDPPADDGTGSFGSAVAAAGDIDGDGFADLIVGAPNATGGGRIHIYRGSAGGLVTATPQTIDGPDGGGFGGAVASAGDIDGDGYADVVVGAESVGSGAGKAYVFRGGPAGLQTTPIAIVAPDGGRFGHAVAGAGDFNGDGFGDIVIGADLFSNGTGRAYLFVGSAGGIQPSMPILILAPSAGDFGTSVAFPGDINGDGYSDILVGADLVTPGAADDAGSGYLIYGGVGAMQTATIVPVASPDGADSDFGTCVGGNGDIDGDGYDDIVIGAQFANLTGNSSLSGSGAAHVFFGGMSGLQATSTPIASTDGFNAQMGVACGGVGDDNGDGFSDIVVGATSATFTGAVHVYQGASGGPQLGSNGAGIAIPASGADSELGAAVN